jgi:hypothetical protein
MQKIKRECCPLCRNEKGLTGATIKCKNCGFNFEIAYFEDYLDFVQKKRVFCIGNTNQVDPLRYQLYRNGTLTTGQFLTEFDSFLYEYIGHLKTRPLIKPMSLKFLPHYSVGLVAEGKPGFLLTLELLAYVNRTEEHVASILGRLFPGQYILQHYQKDFINLHNVFFLNEDIAFEFLSLLKGECSHAIRI